jgi:hypothetical protein
MNKIKIKKKKRNPTEEGPNKRVGAHHHLQTGSSCRRLVEKSQEGHLMAKSSMSY